MQVGIDSFAPAFTNVAADLVGNTSAIPPPAQRAMAGCANTRVTEVSGSHAIYVSKPQEVTEIIRQAADTSN